MRSCATRAGSSLQIAAAIHKGTRLFFARDDLPDEPGALLRACSERAPIGPMLP